MAANLVEGQYRFIDNLLLLEAASIHSTPLGAPPMVSGFLPLSEWDPFLRLLPDKRWSDYLRRGITFCFRIGVPPSAILTPIPTNNQSALLMASAVDKYIADKLTAGTLYPSVSGGNQISPIGFIPKKNCPGKYRMIVNLSAPEGCSGNEVRQVDSSRMVHGQAGSEVCLQESTGSFR